MSGEIGNDSLLLAVLVIRVRRQVACWPEETRVPLWLDRSEMG